MARVINFGAGPAMLPREVLTQVAAEMLDWQGSGMSVMETGHRSAEYARILAAAEADLRELLAIPPSYHVLFLQGGATLQFAMVPLNLMRGGSGGDYVVTGEWSARAAREAARFGTARIAASSPDGPVRHVPAQNRWQLDPAADYVHYCANETIAGVEFNWVPETGAVPLVADMSSNFLSRSVEVERYGLIYAGAQKNVGPAGLTIVIVRADLVGHLRAAAPSLFDYAAQAAAHSMLNTPPTFAIYVAGLVFQWLKGQGGVKAIEARNVEKAQLVYRAIDSAAGFYVSAVAPGDRSRMNATFTIARPGLDGAFLAGARERAMVQLAGHRSVGGMRASLYNAMPLADVATLASYMSEFARRHG